MAVRQIPEIGFGTHGLTGRTCREAVRHAVELGYRHFDTAQSYDNEADVGAGLREADIARDQLFVTTKLAGRDLDPGRVPGAVDASLSRLGTDFVDLLLIHWPNPEIALADTLQAMADAQSQDKVRHLGVSNFPPSWLNEAQEHASILCNQVECHPWLQQHALRRACRERDVLVVAYSPLAQGQVTDEPVLMEIAREHDVTPAQVALRFLIQLDNTVAIPRSSSGKHRRDNLDVFDFELTDDQMQRIRELDQDQRLIDPADAPDWEV